MTVAAVIAGFALLGALIFVPVIFRINVSPGNCGFFTVHYALFPLYGSSLLRALRRYGPVLRSSRRFLRCRRFRLRLRFSGGDAAETALLHGWLCGVLAALSPLAAPCKPDIALESAFSSPAELAVEGDIAFHLPVPVLLFGPLVRRISPRRVRNAAKQGAS
ncbi:MAG: hypothetical protein LBU28_04120 [Spirochaetaceae bacterium]|jgi:hypothetical protein|nr:hypothetical protein [Spirochaetaceae bacterium]